MQCFAVFLCLAVMVSAAQMDQEEDFGPLDDSDGVESGVLDGDTQDQLSSYLVDLLSDENADMPMVYLPEKRSRYYRRYPWKRQNGRNYDPDSYLCTPTRQEVFHLLMALHEAHSGNLERQVHFCNRRRPARAIFTNIRFIGRR